MLDSSCGAIFSLFPRIKKERLKPELVENQKRTFSCISLFIVACKSNKNSSCLKRHILSKSPLRDLERPNVKFIRATRAFALYGKVPFCTYSTQNNFPIARKFL